MENQQKVENKKFLSYSERISQSESELEKEELSFQNEEAYQTLSGDVLETKRALAKAKKDLNQAYGAVPFDSKAILEAEELVENLERGVEKLSQLKEKLFGGYEGE